MALPSQHITNGPGQRDLELAFIGRNLGALVTFTIFLQNQDESRPMIVRMTLPVAQSPSP